jgi:hypothetical protein
MKEKRNYSEILHNLDSKLTEMIGQLLLSIDKNSEDFHEIVSYILIKVGLEKSMTPERLGLIIEQQMDAYFRLTRDKRIVKVFYLDIEKKFFNKEIPGPVGMVDFEDLVKWAETVFDQADNNIFRSNFDLEKAAFICAIEQSRKQFERLAERYIKKGW